MKKFILRKVGRKRARVPLTLEVGFDSSLPHTDGWVGVDEVSGLVSVQRYFGYRGFQSWLCLAGIPNQSCHCPCFPSWTTIAVGVGLPRISPQKCENKKSPQDSSDNLWGLAQEPGGLHLQYSRYETTCYFTCQSELDGCKVI